MNLSNSNEYSSKEENVESWRSLQKQYQRKPDVHYQYRYLVQRLVDSDIAAEFMIGESWVFTDPDRIGTSVGKTVDEVRREYIEFKNAPPSYPRGLFFTKGPFGLELRESHFVCVFANRKNKLVAQYCFGEDVLQSHLCLPRKEIPCLISLLRLLDRDY